MTRTLLKNKFRIKLYILLHIPVYQVKFPERYSNNSRHLTALQEKKKGGGEASNSPHGSVRKQIVLSQSHCFYDRVTDLRDREKSECNIVLKALKVTHTVSKLFHWIFYNLDANPIGKSHAWKNITQNQKDIISQVPQLFNFKLKYSTISNQHIKIGGYYIFKCHKAGDAARAQNGIRHENLI